MSRSGSCVVVFTLVLAASVTVPCQAQNRNADSTLYTIYDGGDTSISWLTCGPLPQGSGCYDGGSLGPFVHACSIVQSVPAPLNPTTVLRYVYVLDSGPTSGGATLSVFRRTDAISPSFDTITITRVAFIPMPDLVAGPGATCWMVQNPTFVYATTKQSWTVIAVNKANFSLSYFGGFGVDVSGLTADSYGFVTIDWGSFFTSDHAVLGPDGQVREFGPGTFFMINPTDGLDPRYFPATR